MRVELNLVGVAMRAECKMIDKIVDGVTARVLDHPFAVLEGVILSIFGVGVTTFFHEPALIWQELSSHTPGRRYLP
jgi:hypothetical protein